MFGFIIRNHKKQEKEDEQIRDKKKNMKNYIEIK